MFYVYQLSFDRANFYYMLNFGCDSNNEYL